MAAGKLHREAERRAAALADVADGAAAAENARESRRQQKAWAAQLEAAERVELERDRVEAMRAQEELRAAKEVSQ